VVAASLQMEAWSRRIANEQAGPAGRRRRSRAGDCRPLFSTRRTSMASITLSGVEKLRTNFLYRIPGVGVGKYRLLLAED
jgi:hypothetical protein